MVLSPAAKVGAVTLVSVVALAVGLSWLTGISVVRRGYDFQVTFHDVAGLMQGANVLLMGVKVGKVVVVTPQAREVNVRVHIFSDDVRILKSSRFKIMSLGLIGENALEIFPSASKNGTAAKVKPLDTEYVAHQSFVRGEDPARLELVMDEVTQTFEALKQNVDPDKFKALFDQTAANLVETTTIIKRVGERAERVVVGFEKTPRELDRLLATTNQLSTDADRLVQAVNPQDVQRILQDVRALSRGLLLSYRTIFGAEGQQAAYQLKGDVRGILGQVEQLVTNLNAATGDPQTRADMRDTIHNIRDLTGRLAQAASITQPQGVGNFTLEPQVQAVAAYTPRFPGVRGSETKSGVAANLGVRMRLGSNSVVAGIEQLGEGNFFNLTLGDPVAWGTAGYHFGMIRSKVGAGLDLAVNPALSLHAQAYDPFAPTLRLGALYFPVKNSPYGLTAQWAREVAEGNNYAWLGLEWRPNAR